MSLSRRNRILLTLSVLGLTGGSVHMASAQDALPPPDFSDETLIPEAPTEISPDNQTSLDMIAEVIEALDAEATRNGNNWQFTLEEQMLIVVTDVNAGRMRIITPIAESNTLPEEALERLMQANFDTALDARYAIGQGLVWSVFIHPLDSLTTRDFASGVLQTKSLADTFGTTFSSGALNYGGGDSAGILEEQLKELLEQLEQNEAV
ncbi:MAG: hypothetical protein ABJ205_11150 [Erythrobacter sp.]|uniref:hypothetical protein n=1 Tax=Erythrobacter sp. TaxID=1042 RepID=UPI0032636BF5